jgi:hypothetical protein
VPLLYTPLIAHGAIDGAAVELFVDRFRKASVDGGMADRVVAGLTDPAFAADPFEWARLLPANVPGLRWRHITEGQSLGLAEPPEFPTCSFRGLPATVAPPGREVVISFSERGSDLWRVHIGADGRVLGWYGRPEDWIAERRVTVAGELRFATDPEKWTKALAEQFLSDFWCRVEYVVRAQITAPGFDIAARSGTSHPHFSIGISASGAVTLAGAASLEVAALMEHPVVVNQKNVEFERDPLTWLRCLPCPHPDTVTMRPPFAAD